MSASDPQVKKWASRSFAIAAWFTLFASVALAWGWLGGGEYVALATTIMTLYFGSDWLKKRDNVEP